MSKWDDPAGWKQEKGSFVRKGGEFVMYGVSPTTGTFVFSAMLTKGHRLQWVLNCTDANNYVLFQMDDNNFYRTVVRNGQKGDETKIPHKVDKKSFHTLQIRVGPNEIIAPDQARGHLGGSGPLDSARKQFESRQVWFLHSRQRPGRALQLRSLRGLEHTLAQRVSADCRSAATRCTKKLPRRPHAIRHTMIAAKRTEGRHRGRSGRPSTGATQFHNCSDRENQPFLGRHDDRGEYIDPVHAQIADGEPQDRSGAPCRSARVPLGLAVAPRPRRVRLCRHFDPPARPHRPPPPSPVRC